MKPMQVLYVGGVADGEHYEHSDNVRTARHSFKLSGDFPSDDLRHHDYSRHFFTIKNDDETTEIAPVMVWNDLPTKSMSALVEERLHAKIME